jgi:hypothetical protein
MTSQVYHLPLSGHIHTIRGFGEVGINLKTVRGRERGVEREREGEPLIFSNFGLHLKVQRNLSEYLFINCNK